MKRLETKQVREIEARINKKLPEGTKVFIYKGQRDASEKNAYRVMAYQINGFQAVGTWGQQLYSSPTLGGLLGMIGE